MGMIKDTWNAVTRAAAQDIKKIFTDTGNRVLNSKPTAMFNLAVSGGTAAAGAAVAGLGIYFGASALAGAVPPAASAPVTLGLSALAIAAGGQAYQHGWHVFKKCCARLAA